MRRSLTLCVIALTVGCSPPVRGLVRTVPEDADEGAPGQPIRTHPRDALPPAQPVSSRSVRASEGDVRGQVLGAELPDESGRETASEEARAEGRRVEAARERNERRAGRDRDRRLERERERRAEDHEQALVSMREAWEQERPARVDELVAEARARALEGAQSAREAARELAATLSTRAIRWRQRARQARTDADESWRKAQVYVEQGVRSRDAELDAVASDRRAHQLDQLATQAEVESEWGREAADRLARTR